VRYSTAQIAVTTPSTSNIRISTIRIGTAGWAIPAPVASEFPGEGSALARYADVFNAVEINSTFRKSHRAGTYERWASSVSADFQFCAKVPKAVTHVARLTDCEATVGTFLDEVIALGAKLRTLLLQLPPSFAFAPDLVESACEMLNRAGRFTVACEPRHASWFNPEVDGWLAERRIARVASDPARHPGAGEPGGWRGLSYYRWHGSPRMYYSSYSDDALAALGDRVMNDEAGERWCIFDNTASGAAASNALTLARRMATG